MIIDYSEYITEKASKGLVNFLTVDNRLPLFVHNSICPFCKEKIESTVYSTKKQIILNGYMDNLTRESRLFNALNVDGGSISIQIKVMLFLTGYGRWTLNIHPQY